MISYDPSSNIEMKVGFRVPELSLQTVNKVISSGGNSDVTDRDVLLKRNTGATVDRNQQITSDGMIDPVYESIDTGIGTVDASGLVSRVSNGTARVNVSVKGVKQQIEVPLIRQTGQTQDTFYAWTDGSFAKHIADKIDGDLSTKIASDETMNYFSSVNHSTKSYVWNPNLWLNVPRSALTCISVWNSQYGQVFPATLITSRHAICRTHVGISVGKTVRFVDANGVAQDRMVTAAKDLTGQLEDTRVLLFNSAFTNAITPAKLFPANITSYIPNVKYGIPMILRNQELKCTVFDLSFIGQFNAVFSTPVNTKRKEFWKLLEGGDSGTPAFVVSNNQLGLISQFSYASQGGIFHLKDWSAILNQLDSQVGSPTNLLPQYLSMSAFESY